MCLELRASRLERIDIGADLSSYLTVTRQMLGTRGSSFVWVSEVEEFEC